MTKTNLGSNIVGGKAELALMSLVVSPTNNEEALEICKYIAGFVDNHITKVPFEWYNAKMADITKSHTIYGISVSTVEGMAMLNLMLEPFSAEEFNTFSYVLNFSVPLFSEYGYATYEPMGTNTDLLHRVY